MKYRVTGREPKNLKQLSEPCVSRLLFEFPIVPGPVRLMPLKRGARLMRRRSSPCHLERDGVDAALAHHLLLLGVHPPRLDVRAATEVLLSAILDKNFTET